MGAGHAPAAIPTRRKQLTKQRSLKLDSLCVFCGSSPGADPMFRQAAVRLGRQLAEEGITLIFGGGHLGMMGILSDAVLAADGRVVGIIPEHLMRVEPPSRELSKLIVVDSMHTRKRRMFDMADAFCVLPGGAGTLDETFEILTWKQLHLHNKPIILANLAGFWDPLLALVDAVIGGGFAQADLVSLLSVVDCVEEVIPAARRAVGTAFAGPAALL
jgi:uncharacterized protein (TIGR00730 family)